MLATPVSRQSTGDVYNLTTIEDISGNYAAAGVGVHARGSSLIAMQSRHGVVIQDRSTTAGLRLRPRAFRPLRVTYAH